MKAIERILWLAYGNDTTGGETREKAEIVLETLSRSGTVSQGELMQQIGLDELVQSDVERFNEIVKPLRGNASTNSSFSEPPELSFISTEDGYRLSRTAFDASLRKLRSDVTSFLENQQGNLVHDHKVRDQLLWLAYANNGNTYSYRQNAAQVLKHLLAFGESSKADLMEEAGLEYGDENDDQQFRGMMKYLRGSWESEDDALNPLHTSNHGFLVRQEMKGQEAYYDISVREFTSCLNVWAGNIRSFLES